MNRYICAGYRAMGRKDVCHIRVLGLRRQICRHSRRIMFMDDVDVCKAGVAMENGS